MTTTTTPARVTDRDVRPCRAAGEHVRAARHTRAECDAHAAAVAAARVARNDAWGVVLAAEPGTPEHDAATAALAIVRAEEARVRAGEPATPPGLTLRTDGRYEVHDTAAANVVHGCPADDWCILARWHYGPCCEDREHDAHTEPLDATACSCCPDLTRVRLTKTGHDPAQPWELWLPRRGALVEHLPFIDRYDVGVYTSDDDVTGDDRAARDEVPLTGMFGTTYWPKHEDAIAALRALERDYPRPATPPSP